MCGMGSTARARCGMWLCEKCGVKPQHVGCEKHTRKMPSRRLTELALLRDAALVLCLPDVAVTVAMSYLHRAAAGEAASLDDITASLFLSCKVCECPRRIRDVINALHIAQNEVALLDSHEYWACKERALLAEQLLLRSLGWNTAFTDRQVLCLQALQHLTQDSDQSLPQAMRELSIALLNDCAGDATCERQPHRVLATAAIRLAAFPSSLSSRRLSRILEVEPDDDALDAVCHV